MASIHAVASLHALVTLALLTDSAGYTPSFTSLLLTLQRVPGGLREALPSLHRFRVSLRRGWLDLPAARPRRPPWRNSMWPWIKRLARTGQ